MTQRSLFWDGVLTGDHGPYTQAQLMDRFFRILLNGTGNRGVLKGWLNQLAVSGTSSPVSVDTGAGIIYGMFYTNDAAVTMTIPTPSAGTSRYDRIVLRRLWATQQVRVTRISGVAAAAPAVPAMAQTAGSVYDVPLATVLISNTGEITVTDTREYCQISTSWPADSVATANIVDDAVGPDVIPDRIRYELKEAGSIYPDSSDPFVWTVGGSYDYWEATDGATTAGWVSFMGPTGLVGAQVDIYVWSLPNVNGGGGVENCQWDYSAYVGDSGTGLTNTAGTTNVDQGARTAGTIYRDEVISGLSVGAGQPIILQLSRDGAADSYNHDIELLGVEMVWTADA